LPFTFARVTDVHLGDEIDNIEPLDRLLEKMSHCSKHGIDDIIT
jgi:hypothetical protein